MTKMIYLRLVCLITLIWASDVHLYARSSSESDQKTFHIGVKGVFDRTTETELLGADYLLIDTQTDSVVKKGKALREWEEQGQVVKTSSFKIKDIPGQCHFSVFLV